MNFEEALRDELIKIPELFNKVFPLKAKEGITPPYVVYVSNEGLQDKTLTSYLKSKEVEFEINIIQGSYSTLKSATKVVLDKILSFQGRVIGIDGPLVQNVSYEKPVELYEKEIALYRTVIEFKIKF